MNRVLIVENELLTAERIRVCLETSNEYHVDVTSSGEDAIELSKIQNYDVVIMDIHLDGKIDGVTTAKAITKMNAVPIIFITEIQSEDVFINASDIFPHNYLVKPFNNSTILYAVKLALDKAETREKANDERTYAENDGVFIPVTSGQNVKLLYADILYLKANGAYTDIYYDTYNQNKKDFYRVSVSSNHVAKKLAFDSLIKVNRSYYVNIKKIERIHRSSIFIKGEEITVSSEYNTVLKDLLHIFKH
jgi:two-component system, response regulator PdtaR